LIDAPKWPKAENDILIPEVGRDVPGPRAAPWSTVERMQQARDHILRDAAGPKSGRKR